MCSVRRIHEGNLSKGATFQIRTLRVKDWIRIILDYELKRLNWMLATDPMTVCSSKGCLVTTIVPLSSMELYSFWCNIDVCWNAGQPQTTLCPSPLPQQEPPQTTWPSSTRFWQPDVGVNKAEHSLQDLRRSVWQQGIQYRGDLQWLWPRRRLQGQQDIAGGDGRGVQLELSF